jgi:hypothetical protein
MAASPTRNDQKWLTWLDTIASTQTVPDIYSWHQIGNWSGEPDTTVPDFNSMKAVHGLPDLSIDINEYGDKREQNPANSVYYIAQLERHQLRGLRANWGSKGALHDYLANLIYAKNGTYYPNGEWQLYKYYSQMKGDCLATTASPDRRFDVFATKYGSTVKIIAGTRTFPAYYKIEVLDIQSLGLPANGVIRAKVLRFDWRGDLGLVDAPVLLGSTNLSYASNVVSHNT